MCVMPGLCVCYMCVMPGLCVCGCELICLCLWLCVYVNVLYCLYVCNNDTVLLKKSWLLWLEFS